LFTLPGMVPYEKKTGKSEDPPLVETTHHIAVKGDEDSADIVASVESVSDSSEK
jgi:hypothetical protein